MVKLEIDHVSKRYWLEREAREVPVLIDVTLSVADGEFLAIVGPSGCGKTSLLNIVAGLLPCEQGSVKIDGRKVPRAIWPAASRVAALVEIQRPTPRFVRKNGIEISTSVRNMP